MDAAGLRKYLKTEFGIRNDEEFELAVSRMKGVNLGIFTIPLARTHEKPKRIAANY